MKRGVLYYRTRIKDANSCAVEPLTGEVFRMPHETELWDTHVLFYRHRIFFFTVMLLH